MSFLPSGPQGSFVNEPAESRADSRRRFWDLVLIGATTEFRNRFSDSTLGYLWTILQPLLLFGVLYAVFTRVIRFGGTVQDYPMVLLLGVSLFLFFREAVGAALRSFVGRGSILRSVRMNPLALPVAAILARTFMLGFTLIVALVWTLAYGVGPRLSWLLFPLALVYLLALILGVGVLLASIYVRVRDVNIFWQSISRLLLFSSPVLFPFELIPGGAFQAIAALNPLSPLLVEVRRWVIDPGAPSWPDAAGGTVQALLPFVTLVVLCAAGAVAFRLVRPGLAENL